MVIEEQELDDLSLRDHNADEANRLFNAEFYPHMSALYSFAYRLSLNEDDAHDLLQETYEKALKSFRSYQANTHAKAWLFRIMKNSFINGYRRRSRKPEAFEYNETDGWQLADEHSLHQTSDLRNELFGKMLGDEMTLALNRLPVDFRLILLLSDIEEFTYEEMSKIIGIPIGTVRSRLHRARKLMKDQIGHYARKMGYGDEH
jgi:RNA polymerase sigma-70 factor (ECF subfamily)